MKRKQCWRQNANFLHLRPKVWVEATRPKVCSLEDKAHGSPEKAKIQSKLPKGDIIFIEKCIPNSLGYLEIEKSK